MRKICLRACSANSSFVFDGECFIFSSMIALSVYRDENSQPFSIRKICRLTPKWRKAIFKSLIKGFKSQKNQ